MDIKDILSASIKAAAKSAMDKGVLKEGTLPEVQLEVPPQKEFGDFASNFAMQSARSLKCNPRMIAQAIVDNMDCAYFDKMEIAGPGFINFFMKEDSLQSIVSKIINKKNDYGRGENKKTKIDLEFVSANPTGDLHVGHARGAAIGDSLCRILSFAGYDVDREYYINDAGNQIYNLALSIQARYREILGLDYVLPEDGYHGKDIIEIAQSIVDEIGDKGLTMDDPISYFSKRVELLNQQKKNTYFIKPN